MVGGSMMRIDELKLKIVNLLRWSERYTKAPRRRTSLRSS